MVIVLVHIIDQFVFGKLRYDIHFLRKRLQYLVLSEQCTRRIKVWIFLFDLLATWTTYRKWYPPPKSVIFLNYLLIANQVVTGVSFIFWFYGLIDEVKLHVLILVILIIAPSMGLKSLSILKELAWNFCCIRSLLIVSIHNSASGRYTHTATWSIFEKIWWRASTWYSTYCPYFQSQ